HHETPGTPSHQDYSTPTHHETNHHSHHAKEKGLPDTGNDDSTHNVTLFGGLLALLGSLFFFGNKRRNRKDEH
ncbi:LPXTG-motif cell wall anchor domain protein, partial [Staphylococcus caprae M23864:W1]